MSDGSRFSEELQTARLSLRRPSAADIDAIFEIHSDSRACLHNPSDRLNQRERAEELYQRWNEQWQRCGYGYWVVRCRGSAGQLGFCGIEPMELNGMKILNLFYRFTPPAWGHGLAGEAATAVTAWASRQIPGLPLIARVRPANVRFSRTEPTVLSSSYRDDFLDNLFSQVILRIISS
jgi:RimJ/RimL family protein N-acetyltransferase